MKNRSPRPPLRALASLLGLAGILLGLAGPALPARAYARPDSRILQTEAAISIVLLSTEVLAGSTVTVDIYIEGVTELDYVDVLVTFDPILLEVVDADAEQEGVQIAVGEEGMFFVNPDVLVNSVVQGEITLALEAVSPVTGYGVLGRITFYGKAAGVSPVTIDEEWLYLEGPGGRILPSIHNGSVTVIGSLPTAGPSSTPTYTPTPGPSPTPTQTPTPGPSSTPTQTPTPGPSPTPTQPPTAGPSPTPTSGPPPTSALATPSASSPTSTSPPLPTATTAGVLYYRVMQIWPDRSQGVASGQLEGSANQAAVALPFGVYSTSTGEIVRARTYLHFPLDVFAPGSEILRATLYVYVDSSAGGGEATFGVYRPLEAWDEGTWGSDPADWPTLLTSPIALTTTFAFAATHSAAAVRRPLLASAPVAASTLALSARSETMLNQALTPKVFDSPLSPLTTPTPPTPTPTRTPTPGPAATATASSQPTLPTTAQPTASPRPTLPPASTAVPGAAPPVVTLRQVEGTWLTWDVTALARAWLAREVADAGLALAAAPNPDAGPEAAGNLLVARWFTVDDPVTRPYLIAEIVVHPVTPTPIVLLPSAGSSSTRQWSGTTLLVVGAVLLALGLVVRRRRVT